MTDVSIDQLRSLNKGAFAPWTANPVMHALLIPFGGAGIAAVLEAVATMNL